MKVLNVNVTDRVGSRFNNLDLRGELLNEGVESRFLVWNQTEHQPGLSRLFRYPGSRRVARFVSKIERKMSVHSMLHMNSFLLPTHGSFRDADVVHYHIIHDGYFSLWSLPFLTSLKPSVWTFHDPWPMTGHCIYPLECERWKIGCGACPRLDLPFPLRVDRTHFQFRRKKAILPKLKVEVVLASKHMMDMADRSPIAGSMKRHMVPFGVDLQKFRPRPREEARRRLGILPGRVVIGLRAADGPYKGLDMVNKALDLISPTRPVCILTTQGHSQFNRFIGKHQIIELGWVNDDNALADAYAATDFFVMPSDAEAFGMMAIEAMASGVPVIVTDGTSLPEVTFAPDVGISTPKGQPHALAQAISRLINNEDERRIRGERSRKIAEAHYDSRIFAKRLADVYKTAIERRKAPTQRGGKA